MRVLYLVLVLVIAAYSGFACSVPAAEPTRFATVDRISEPIHTSSWVCPPYLNIGNYQPGLVVESMKPADFEYVYSGYDVYSIISAPSDLDEVGTKMLTYMQLNLAAGNAEFNMGSMQQYFKDTYGFIPSPSEISSRLQPLIDKGFLSVSHHALTEGAEPNTVYLAVHNGYAPAEDKWVVTTYADDTTVTVALKKILRDSSITNVYEISSTGRDGSPITAPPDNPVALSYDPQTNDLEIGGLAANSVRILDVKYHHESPATFAVYCEYGETPAKGYTPIDAGSWVTISDSEVSVMPYDTVPVAVSFQTPSDIVLPRQWEFDVMVSEKVSGNVVTRTATRFLVTMR